MKADEFLKRAHEARKKAEEEAFRQTIGGRIAEMVRLLGTDHISGSNLNVEDQVEGEDGEQIWYPPRKIMEVARRDLGDDIEIYYISEDLAWIIVHESIDRTEVQSADTVPVSVLKQLFRL